MRFITGLTLLLLILAPPAFAAPVVLVDEGHGQAFKTSESGPLHLSKLAALMDDAGIELRTTSAPLTGPTLAGASGVVLSGSFAPYRPEEVEALVQFVAQGGRLAVMLHIAPPFSPLLQRFGVIHSNGVVRESEHILEGEALNFRVVELAPHPLTEGLAGFSLYGAWALLPEGSEAKTLARTGPRAWVDLNGNGTFDQGDAQESLAVVVAGRHGKGEFVIFSDDAIFQNSFLQEENVELARNLARWLAGS